MPRRYVQMRNRFKRQGMSTSQAQEKAARIYNSTRKPGQRPVTRKHRT
jgi:hypothetical protein